MLSGRNNSFLKYMIVKIKLRKKRIFQTLNPSYFEQPFTFLLKVNLPKTHFHPKSLQVLFLVIKKSLNDKHTLLSFVKSTYITDRLSSRHTCSDCLWQGFPAKKLNGQQPVHQLGSTDSKLASSHFSGWM